MKKLDEFEYMNLLERLLEEGKPYAKTTPRFAYAWPALVVHTETSGGALETEKEVNPDVYIVFDPAGFPTSLERESAFEAIVNRFSVKAVLQEDMRAVDFRGPDLWIVEGKKFRAEFEPDPSTPRRFLPNEEARTSLRQCLSIGETVEFPVQWGTFIVEAGGAIATRVSDMPAIRAALDAVARETAFLTAAAAPEKTAEDMREETRACIVRHLYNGDGTTLFDVYGMKPGFLEKNYDLQVIEGQKPVRTPAPPKP